MVKIRDTNELYKHVYNLLIEGKHQAEISRILGYDKARISRITRDLINAGYLLCVDPFSRVKFYEATKKKFYLKDVKAMSKITSENSQRSRRRCNILRISKARFKTNVKGYFGKKIKWDKGPVKINNGVIYYDYNYPFANLGNVKFRYFENNKSLLIILPQVLWEKEAGPPDDYLREMANKCGTWFMKKFRVDLQGLEVVQKPDIGAALRDPGLIHAAQNYSFNLNGDCIDASAPDYSADYESKDFNKVVTFIEIIPKVMDLEEKVNRIEDAINILTDKLDHIINIIENPPVKPITPDTFNSYI